jgi:hypothetical protein
VTRVNGAVRRAEEEVEVPKLQVLLRAGSRDVLMGPQDIVAWVLLRAGSHAVSMGDVVARGPSSSILTSPGTEYRYLESYYPGQQRHSSETKRVGASGDTPSNIWNPSRTLEWMDGKNIGINAST